MRGADCATSNLAKSILSLIPSASLRTLSRMTRRSSSHGSKITALGSVSGKRETIEQFSKWRFKRDTSAPLNCKLVGAEADAPGDEDEDEEEEDDDEDEGEEEEEEVAVEDVGPSVGGSAIEGVQGGSSDEGVADCCCPIRGEESI